MSKWAIDDYFVLDQGINSMYEIKYVMGYREYRLFCHEWGNLTMIFVTSSLVKIIAESALSWQKNNIDGKPYIILSFGITTKMYLICINHV